VTGWAGEGFTRRNDESSGETMTNEQQPASGHEGQVQVWRPDSGKIEWVSPIEAASGMIAWGKAEYGEGTPAFAAVVHQAIDLLAAHGLTPAGKKIGKGDG
jgi:hypothetical protein